MSESFETYQGKLNKSVRTLENKKIFQENSKEDLIVGKFNKKFQRNIKKTLMKYLKMFENSKNVQKFLEILI